MIEKKTNIKYSLKNYAEVVCQLKKKIRIVIYIFVSVVSATAGISSFIKSLQRQFLSFDIAFDTHNEEKLLFVQKKS